MSMHPSQLLPSDIARAVLVPEEKLWYIAHNTRKFYLPMRKVNVKGKERDIDPPHQEYKAMMRRLHRFLQKNFRPHPAVHGGAKGKSCFTAAKKHLGRKFVITRDVVDCYPSITEQMLFQSLCKLGFRRDTARVLSLLFTLRDRIPQGSPVSSDALNLFLYDVDRALSASCGAVGANYTRTYDDMVASIDKTKHMEMPGKCIEKQIDSHGLKVNRRKRKKQGLQRRHKEQRVHNLIVSSKRGVRIPREQQRKALELAERYVRGAKAVSPACLEALAHKRERIFGFLCHFRQAYFSNARHLWKLIRSGDRIVSRRLDQIGLTPHRNKWWVMVKGHRNEPKRLANLWRTKSVLKQTSSLRTVSASSKPVLA